MPRNVAIDTLQPDALVLTFGLNGDVAGVWKYKLISSATGERISKVVDEDFTVAEQASIKGFMNARLNALKASEGV